MRYKLELYAKCKAGKLEYNDDKWKEKYKNFLDLHDESDILIAITSVRDGKTLAQLRFYWGAVLPAICKAIGYSDRYEVHDYLKNLYLSEIKELTIKDNENHYVSVPSLSDLPKNQMRDYIERCIEFMVDNGGELNHDMVDAFEQGWKDAIQ
jgi:hypothetical protein